LASVATAQLGNCRRRGDLLPLKQHAEWHLYDTPAPGAACVNVREAELFQFSNGAGVDGHAGGA